MKNIPILNLFNNKHQYYSPMVFKKNKVLVLKKFIMTGMKSNEDYTSIDVNSNKYGGPLFTYNMEFEINKNVINQYSKDEKKFIQLCLNYDKITPPSSNFNTNYNLIT